MLRRTAYKISYSSFDQLDMQSPNTYIFSFTFCNCNFKIFKCIFFWHSFLLVLPSHKIRVAYHHPIAIKSYQPPHWSIRFLKLLFKHSERVLCMMATTISIFLIPLWFCRLGLWEVLRGGTKAANISPIMVQFVSSIALSRWMHWNLHVHACFAMLGVYVSKLVVMCALGLPPWVWFALGHLGHLEFNMLLCCFYPNLTCTQPCASCSQMLKQPWGYHLTSIPLPEYGELYGRSLCLYILSVNT